VISRLSLLLVVYVYLIARRALTNQQHGPMIDLAFDKEFAKLVEEVCHIIYQLLYMLISVLQRQEARLSRLPRTSCSRPR